jgi:hypothetical protein
MFYVLIEIRIFLYKKKIWSDRDHHLWSWGAEGFSSESQIYCKRGWYWTKLLCLFKLFPNPINVLGVKVYWQTQTIEEVHYALMGSRLESKTRLSDCHDILHCSSWSNFGWPYRGIFSRKRRIKPQLWLPRKIPLKQRPHNFINIKPWYVEARKICVIRRK